MQPSQVYYMELVNENPDSDETMSMNAKDLLDKFNVDGQDGWVLLVGDGKTYQHLMNIKRQYGTTFKKVLETGILLSYSYESLLPYRFKRTG